eukprot:g19379.t1
MSPRFGAIFPMLACEFGILMKGPESLCQRVSILRSGPVLPTITPLLTELFPPTPYLFTACRRRENRHSRSERQCPPKKARLVFSDAQRRTLLAVFRENPQPSKQMQAAIAAQLGLELSTVANFFMNSRRRSLDKWAEEGGPRPVGPVTSVTTFKGAYAN